MYLKENYRKGFIELYKSNQDLQDEIRREIIKIEGSNTKEDSAYDVFITLQDIFARETELTSEFGVHKKIFNSVSTRQPFSSQRNGAEDFAFGIFLEVGQLLFKLDNLQFGLEKNSSLEFDGLWKKVKNYFYENFLKT